MTGSRKTPLCWCPEQGLFTFQVGFISPDASLAVNTHFWSCYGNPSSARLILKDISHIWGWLLCDSKGFSHFLLPGREREAVITQNSLLWGGQRLVAGRAASTGGLFSLDPSETLHHGFWGLTVWHSPFSGILLATCPPPTGLPEPIRGTSSLNAVTHQAAELVERPLGAPGLKAVRQEGGFPGTPWTESASSHVAVYLPGRSDKASHDTDRVGRVLWSRAKFCKWPPTLVTGIPLASSLLRLQVLLTGCVSISGLPAYQQVFGDGVNFHLSLYIGIFVRKWILETWLLELEKNNEWPFLLALKQSHSSHHKEDKKRLPSSSLFCFCPRHPGLHRPEAGSKNSSLLLPVSFPQSPTTSARGFSSKRGAERRSTEGST